MRLHIREATPDDAADLAATAIALTGEIKTRTGAPHSDVDRADTEALCRRLVGERSYVALLAVDPPRAVGCAGMRVSPALYAGGPFVTVQEFGIAPGQRGAGMGRHLLAAVRDYGRAQSWKRLEPCTPPRPEFDRTLLLYEANGCEVTGGRKTKALLS